MKRARRIAAVDLGGTNIKACVFESEQAGQVVEIESEAGQGGAHLLARAAGLLQTLWPFEALGVSTAGQPDLQSGRIRYANENIPGYTGMDVKGFFAERFGVPVAVMNDVCAAALGEGSHGAACGAEDYICLTFGTGIGGGIVLQGRLYHGAGASAGSMLGGLVLHAEQHCVDDPFSGTYERCASAAALVERVQAEYPQLSTGREIFARIQEPPIRQLVDAWLNDVAAGICSIIHAFNIPLVVLGGGVMEQPYAVEGAKERVYNRLIPGFSGVRIVGAKLGNTAGLYGAAALVDEQLEERIL